MRPTDLAAISADSLDALMQMERQLGRQEGYAEGMIQTGPKPINDAMRERFRELYMTAAKLRFPLPEPFK